MVELTVPAWAIGLLVALQVASIAFRVADIALRRRLAAGARARRKASVDRMMQERLGLEPEGDRPR